MPSWSPLSDWFSPQAARTNRSSGNPASRDSAPLVGKNDDLLTKYFEKSQKNHFNQNLTAYQLWGSSFSPSRGFRSTRHYLHGYNKMSIQKTDNWIYTNEYGEQWIFEYDSLTGEGILKGSEINWKSYKVIEGKVPGLLLNDGELIWLKETWKKATADKKP